MCSVCPCAPACPVRVPCVSRLPPVSFYRYVSCVSRLPPVSFYRYSVGTRAYGNLLGENEEDGEVAHLGGVG